MAHSPRKTAKQARSQATQDAIIEAAARFLETQGWGGLTTNHIAELAGVSIGTLYQYYANKEAIIADLLRRERRILFQGLLNAKENAASAEPHAVVTEMIKVALDHQFARPVLALELEHIEASLGMEEEAAQLAAQTAQEILAVIRGLEPSATMTTARDVVAIVRGIVNAAAFAGEKDLADIEARVQRAVGGYLG